MRRELPMTLVPRTRTTPTIAQWRDAIAAAWLELRGVEPSLEALSVLWAQFALETGRGANCWCWNLGNIMSGGAWAGDADDLPTWEMIGGKHIDITERFRAYASLADGARDYLRFLFRESYAKAMERIEAGDAAGFGHVLKLLGFYTALETDYVGGLRSLAAEFKHIIASVRATLPIVPTDAENEALECLFPASFEHHELATSLVCSTCHDPANDNSPTTQRSAA